MKSDFYGHFQSKSFNFTLLVLERNMYIVVLLILKE